MRWLLPSLLMLLSIGASAAPEDMQKRDYSKSLEQENVRFLRELTQLVEAKGYRSVRIVPQLFVAKARGENGEDYTLIINSDTLNALRFDGRLPLAENGESPETVFPSLH
jgi:hypothetical protein